MAIIGTKEASERLGLSVERIRALIRTGKLKAIKIGNGWVIEDSNLGDIIVYGRSGRPPQKKKE